MAGKDYQFNAPTFVDFTKDDYDEVDESYFDLPHKTPRGKTPRRKMQGQQDLKVPAEEREQPPTEQGKQEHPPTEQVASEQEEKEQLPTEQREKQEQHTEQGKQEQPPTEQSGKQEQVPTEQEKQEQPPTEQGKQEQPSTEQGGMQEQVLSEHKESEQMATEEPQSVPEQVEEQGAKQEQPQTEQEEKQEQEPSEHKEPEQVSTEEEPELITEQAEEQGEMPTKQMEEQLKITEQAEQEEMPMEQVEEQEKATTEQQEEISDETEESKQSTEQAEIEQMAIEQEEQGEQAQESEKMEEDPPAKTPKSVSNKRRKSLKLEGAGVRQSPRLLAISKALRRSNARRRSADYQVTTSSQANQVKKTQTQKRVVPKVSGVSITEGDKEELELVATFRQKITTNKKRKDGAAPNQPLKTTKPQEFHFATDKRLRKQEVEDPAPLPPPPAARSTRSGPTKPQEFTFATDKRIKGKESVKEEDEGPVEFAKSLRSSTLSLNKDTAGRRTPTNPKPFHLSECRKEQSEAAKRFLSMADLSCKNYIRTPDVVRNKRTTSTDDHENRKKPRGPTVAVTPKLATSRRRRSLSLMTREEREQQEFEEAQKHAFKARPVNKKALQTPPNGYRVPAKPQGDAKPQADAKPQGAMKPQSDTKPQGHPSENLIDEMMNIDSPPKMLVAMLPYAGLSMQGKKSNTKLKPFSFDKRDQERLKKKEEKIKKVLEDEKSLAEFHARPMPLFEGVGVPPRKPPTPTQVKPFALNVERRGSIKQEKFKQQLEDAAKRDVEQRKFHAQDDSVVRKNPFVPQKSNRPLVEISNVTLSTEVRAMERSKFDQQQKQMEEEMLAAKKMAEEQRAAEEQEEVTRMREAAVHKAQPVPKNKPMVLQPTAQLPTVPVSPDFATDSRLRARSRVNSTFNL